MFICTISVKLVTLQVFVELEIPHIYHSVARNSPKRKELVDKWDVFQVPYIEVGFAVVAQNTLQPFGNKNCSALPALPTPAVWRVCGARACDLLCGTFCMYPVEACVCHQKSLVLLL